MTFEEIIIKSKNLSITELKILIGNILRDVDYNSIVCENQKFDGFYRARQHNQIDGENDDYKFTNEKEYWNPPTNSVTELGRCNDIGESVFYCSNEIETAILEIRPEKEKYITMAHFEPIIKDGRLPVFRMKPNCIQHLKKIKGLEICIRDFDLSKRDKKFITVDNLLDDLFTEVVSNNEKHKYKITNAISQCMLVNMVNQYKDEFSMNGMIYPSIVNNRNSINILLKPFYARNNFIIKVLQTFQILEVESNYVVLKLLKSGFPKGKKNHPSEELEIFWNERVDGPEFTIEY